MDQRKVNMLAREYAKDKKKRFKPVIISHHMLMGLKEGQEKMSKSDVGRFVSLPVLCLLCISHDHNHSGENDDNNDDDDEYTNLYNLCFLLFLFIYSSLSISPPLCLPYFTIPFILQCHLYGRYCRRSSNQNQESLLPT